MIKIARRLRKADTVHRIATRTSQKREANQSEFKRDVVSALLLSLDQFRLPGKRPKNLGEAGIIAESMLIAS